MELDNSTAFIQNFDEIVAALNSKTKASWLVDLRNNSLSRFKSIGLPSIKDDDYKYTNISPITKHTYQIATESSLKETNLLSSYLNLEDISIVFVNGAFSKELSVLTDIPGGLSINSLENATLQDDQTIKDLFFKYHPDDEGSFITLNNMLCSDGAFVKINQNAFINKVIHIVHVTSSSEEKILSSPRSLIFLDNNSHATVIESHINFSEEQVYLSNGMSDIFLSEDAKLDYIRIQNENHQAFHLCQTRIWQEKESFVSCFSLSSGASLVRNNINVIVNGEGSSTEIYGTSTPDNHQHFDNHVSIDHRMPNCKSNIQFMGVLGDFTNNIFDGRISMRPIAHNAQATLTNTNLIIGKDCHVYTRPQFENSANLSTCNYSTSTNRIKENDIIEIQSEDISRQEAIHEISKKFLLKNIEKLRNPSAANRAIDILENKIDSIICE